jgi:hypothetical protein
MKRTSILHIWYQTEQIHLEKREKLIMITLESVAEETAVHQRKEGSR